MYIIEIRFRTTNRTNHSDRKKKSKKNTHSKNLQKLIFCIYLGLGGHAASVAVDVNIFHLPSKAVKLVKLCQIRQLTQAQQA